MIAIMLTIRADDSSPESPCGERLSLAWSSHPVVPDSAPGRPSPLFAEHGAIMHSAESSGSHPAAFAWCVPDLGMLARPLPALHREVIR